MTRRLRTQTIKMVLGGVLLQSDSIHKLFPLLKAARLPFTIAPGGNLRNWDDTPIHFTQIVFSKLSEMKQAQEIIEKTESGTANLPRQPQTTSTEILRY